MPFSGGVFTRIYSWVADKNANIKILAARMDNEDDGFADAINDIVSGVQPFTGPVSGPNGTAALPGHTFSSDTNTGLYSKSANVIGVTAGGTNAVDFTSTGVQLVAGGGTIDYFGAASWTPVLVGMTTAGTGTYTFQSGHYVRIGGWVIFTMRLAWTAHTGTGAMEIQGLPFANLLGYGSPNSIVPTNLTVPAGETLYSQVNSTASTIQLASAPLVGGALTDLAMDTSGSIVISGNYRVA